jgi:hypothetical protein
MLAIGQAALRERVPTSFTITAVPVDSIAVGLALIRRRRGSGVSG